VLDFPHALIDFAVREIAIMGIHRFELAAIDGYDGLGEQVQLGVPCIPKRRMVSGIGMSATVTSTPTGCVTRYASQ
jgi:hypothetical protein